MHLLTAISDGPRINLHSLCCSLNVHPRVPDKPKRKIKVGARGMHTPAACEIHVVADRMRSHTTLFDEPAAELQLQVAHRGDLFAQDTLSQIYHPHPRASSNREFVCTINVTAHCGCFDSKRLSSGSTIKHPPTISLNSYCRMAYDSVWMLSLFAAIDQFRQVDVSMIRPAKSTRVVFPRNPFSKQQDRARHLTKPDIT